MFFNTGFQFNYAEPFSLSSFYNATYFQNILDGRQNLDNNVLSAKVENVNRSNTVERSIESGRNDLIGSDVTAAQLYRSIEDNIKE